MTFTEIGGHGRSPLATPKNKTKTNIGMLRVENLYKLLKVRIVRKKERF